MRCALAQFTSTANPETNLATMVEMLNEAHTHSVDLVIFPEAAQQAFGTGRLDEVARTHADTMAQELQEHARKLGLVAVVGMFFPADTVTVGEKTIHRIANRAMFFGLEEPVGYDKIHCYDAFGYRESDTVRPGTSPLVVEVAGVRVGVATCFDIRFPEQFIHLAQQGAELIVVPASWSAGPGKTEQWELLARARALDSTCFVAACGQALPEGEDPEGAKKAPTGVGNSLVAGPDGRVRARAGRGRELLVVDIEVADVASMRRDVPVVAMRQPMPIVGLKGVGD